MSLKYDGRKPEPPYPVNVEIDENELAELRRDAEIVAWIEKHQPIMLPPTRLVPFWRVFASKGSPKPYLGSDFAEAITNAMKASGEK